MMKILSTLTLLAAISLSAQAETLYGSACGLIDSADDLELSQEKTTVLTLDTRLGKLWGNQVLTTANAGLAAYGQTVPLTTSRQGIKALLAWSEGGEVLRHSGAFAGKKLDVIRYFPGGNPVGMIFKKGTVNPIAEIKDSDIVCVK